MKRAVVDQPGFKVIVLGLVLSIILGLSIKSQISPRKIKSRLDQAISRLQPDVKIDFNSVQIKLSDWGWPQPYLEVHDIRISPVKAICDESQIFVETLSFPLSWNLLFDSKKVIKSLRISQLEIRLSEFKNCFNINGSSESVSESVLQQGLAQVFTAPNAEQLQELKIDRIKILSKDNYQMPLYLQAAVLDFSYAEQMLSKISLKAQTVFYNDNQKQLYKIKSDLNLVFEKKDIHTVSIQGHLSGKLIDREYKIQFNYVPNINSFYFMFAAQKLSVKSLSKVFHRENFFSDQLKNELLNFYMSTQGTGYYNLNKNRSENIQITDFKLESDSSSILSEKLKISALTPLEFEQSVFQVKNWELTTALNQIFPDEWLKSHVVQAGNLTGEFEFSSLDQIKGSGTIEKSSFKMSSNKDSEAQVFDKIDFDFSKKGTSKNLLLDHFLIADKNIKGFFKIQNTEDSQTQMTFEMNGDFLTAEQKNELWGSEDPVDLILKGKVDSSFHYDLYMKKLNLGGVQGSDVNCSITPLDQADKKPHLQCKIPNVSWDVGNDQDKSEFQQFYTAQVNLKKVDLEGTYSEGKYQVFIPIKGKKIYLNLDFMNQQFKKVE